MGILVAGTLLILLVTVVARSQTSPAKPPAQATGTTAKQPGQTKTATTSTATTTAQPRKWPREFKKDGNRMVLYQPQIDDWANQLLLKGRAAIQLTPAKAQKPLYGAFSFEAKTKTNPNERTVYIYDWQVTDFTFADKATPPQMQDLAKSLLPTAPVTTGLDNVLAYLEVGKTTGREVKVSTEPPTIFYSTEPALLLITQGEPILVDIKDAGFKYVLNTNWDILVDPDTSQYFLLNKDHWLVTKSLAGPWTATTNLPAKFSKLPADEQWQRVKQSIPPKAAPPATAPKIFYNAKPAELILFTGAPQFASIPGTRLRYVRNTESDVFFHEGDRFFYFLTAGRWFRSAAPADGQWEFASDKLPTDFALIPSDHPKGRVLANVRGTREASEAILQASIPQTVNMKRVSPDVKVEYAGTPEFIAVPGTAVSYAKNTQFDVFLVEGKYYLCYQAAWFVSASPGGPWEPADSVPQDIYQLPPESPKHNVTYVQVQESTPTTVTYVSTPGYTGMYVAYGCVVLGSGYYYPPYYYWPPGIYYPHYYPYPYYGYGMGAAYNPYTGAYVRGGAVYGPYGGYGQWSGYNPTTGTYARGAGWYGPYDAGRYSQAYNPRTGTYSQRYAYTNYEQAWGGSYTQRGDQWAQTKWYADEQGAVGGIRTSEGTGAIAGVNDEHQGFVAKGQDNVYAGKDGNVYKRDENGDWHHYEQGSGWTQVPQESVDARKQQAQGELNERGVSTPNQTSASTPGQTRQTTTAQQPATTQANRSTAATPGTTRTTGATPGTTRPQSSQQPSSLASQRTSSVDRETLNGLNRDATARQTGAQRSQQYSNWGSSRGSSSGSRTRTRSRR